MQSGAETGNRFPDLPLGLRCIGHELKGAWRGKIKTGESEKDYYLIFSLWEWIVLLSVPVAKFQDTIEGHKMKCP